MNIDLEVLERITDTAVEAAGMRDYDISPLEKMHVRPDGTSTVINIKPRQDNELLTLDDVENLFNAEDTAEIYVGRDAITVLHDGRERIRGKSVMPLNHSPAVALILKQDPSSPLAYKPEKFEQIAKLVLCADPLFLSRLRKLNWGAGGSQNMKISNASKSMDSTSLAQVRDENDNVFQDVSLTVAQPWFYTPFQTSVTEIELNVIANAESGTISFAPLPGVMQKLEYAAVDEVFAEVLARIDIKEHPRIFKGKPIVK